MRADGEGRENGGRGEKEFEREKGGGGRHRVDTYGGRCHSMSSVDYPEAARWRHGLALTNTAVRA